MCSYKTNQERRRTISIVSMTAVLKLWIASKIMFSVFMEAVYEYEH